MTTVPSSRLNSQVRRHPSPRFTGSILDCFEVSFRLLPEPAASRSSTKRDNPNFRWARTFEDTLGGHWRTWRKDETGEREVRSETTRRNRISIILKARRWNVVEEDGSRGGAPKLSSFFSFHRYPMFSPREWNCGADLFDRSIHFRWTLVSKRFDSSCIPPDGTDDRWRNDDEKRDDKVRATDDGSNFRNRRNLCWNIRIEKLCLQEWFPWKFMK